MEIRNRSTVRILAAASILMLSGLACGANLSTPVVQIKTGPTQSAGLLVPMPAAASGGVELNLEFVAGELNLSPGASENLASGTATFNAAEFTPRFQAAGEAYTLRSGDLKLEGIPGWTKEVKNEWVLQLADRPMSLNIQAGAYQGNFELGGLSLEKLAISEGGSDLTASFSRPNNVEMSSFTFYTGASRVILNGLANANFESMTFNSGAGDYRLSFDGALRRAASVTVETGAGSLEIVVPNGLNASLTFESGMSTVNTTGGWVQNGNVYTLSGSGPAITIRVKMGMGNLNLKTS